MTPPSAKTRRRRPPTIAARVARIEKRLGLDGAEPTSAAAVSIGDVLRAYPGGIPSLAEDIRRDTDTLYDFYRGRARRVNFPSEVAALVERAFRRARLRPFGVDVTAAWLRRAWYEIPLPDSG